MRPAVISSEDLRRYVDRFNQQDSEGSHDQISIADKDAFEFLESNIPLFDCPDEQFKETYYYRWWCFRKHLNLTPAGWVVTEFLPPVSWAGAYNTISCAAGHHLYEARWLRDRKFAQDYARFWFLPEAQPRNYSFWAANSVRAVTLATGDKRLEKELLPSLIANYQKWEADHRPSNGLFQQSDDRDGMEYSLGGSGFRPSINSYMYGDARAIADIAEEAGQVDLAREFNGKAEAIKGLVQQKLWNSQQEFFETVSPDSGRSCGIREEIGFIPWYFNLPDAGFEDAWKELLEPEGFAACYGPTTVERRAQGFMRSENHDCLWNGPSWPYATTQTLVAMANLLDGYRQTVVTKQNYFDLLLGYSRSFRKDGRPWIAEDLEADTGKWIVDLPRSVNYNHSGFADLVITGLAGLRPRPDGQLVLKPLLPEGAWPWFCVDAIPYHGESLTIVWDSDGRHYRHGAGLSLLINGRVVAHRRDLGDLTVETDLVSASTQPVSSWHKYPGPVLGGSLGTCFDLSLLSDSGKYKMYFSWRPKKSIALSESEDGIHWGEPRILLGPTTTGWEDDINRPGVLKRGDLYYMWYTGQANGRSAIGLATSKDGLNWNRLEKPVLVADEPWEKVAVMCPSVNWDPNIGQFRMWYSGGEQYEPDAIGYATSVDGIHWTKHDGPVFSADLKNRWEQYKVTACQVLEWHGWHYMFYIGFRDIDHAQIGIARSRDGISHWERLKTNPIISPTFEGWDADACYKPYALYDEKAKQWLLWYNGRHGGLEQIGLATKPGKDLGF